MKTRIITGLVLIALFVPLLILSGTIVFPIALAILAAVALFEVANCMGFGRTRGLCIPIAAIGAAAIIIAFFAEPDSFIRYACFGALLLMLCIFAATVFARGKFNFAEISAFFVCAVYITAAFSSIVLLRHDIGGEYLYLLVFIGPWVCDTFAYFTGRLLGRHKLIPEVSPKKTVEGSIGGIVFCIGAYLVFGLVVESMGEFSANYLMLAVTGLAVSIVSQIGDLIASVIKRQHDVKDYGKIFPGHGGVMDRFDSVLPTAIVIYLLSSLSDSISLISPIIN